jgi:hypothetical protein
MKRVVEDSRMFPIITVNSQLAESLEPLGAKRKFWLSDGGVRRLLKLEERGTGEDWAEKLACEFCEKLGLPHVHYDLAFDIATRTPGVVCPTLASPGWVLGLGNQMLGALDPDYPEGNKYKVRAHTPEAVTNVVEVLNPPPLPFSHRLPRGVSTALDVFTGYILLDVWIGNQDRHHENWGVLRGSGDLFSSKLYLAPSFDHGAAMARQLTDVERDRRLTTNDQGYGIAAFARKARSAFYASPDEAKSMTTFAVWEDFRKRTPIAAKSWLERLEAISDAVVSEVISAMPPDRMTDLCRTFTLNLLAENRRRLLEGEEP